uniref:Uncharacterized protein n=1 Tax=Setaria viridis TaxID=4556 RepID=A0A4U6U3Z7_SETVI|nr:hypothetical protein SEVIR_6G115250v2 [Setaria viridis]
MFHCILPSILPSPAARAPPVTAPVAGRPRRPASPVATRSPLPVAAPVAGRPRRPSSPHRPATPVAAPVAGLPHRPPPGVARRRPRGRPASPPRHPSPPPWPAGPAACRRPSRHPLPSPPPTLPPVEGLPCAAQCSGRKGRRRWDREDDKWSLNWGATMAIHTEIDLFWS